MKETFRLRPSSRVLRIALWSTLLLTSLLTAAFCADYPSSRVLRKETDSVHASRRASTANAALFDRDDVARAAKLAVRELRRDSRNVDSWFILSQSAGLLEDRDTELRAILAVCRLAANDDPRAIAAARRLPSLGANSERFRRQRPTLEALADGGSGCAPFTAQALYEAALDGLSTGSVRDLARRAGWQTNWSISRAGVAAAKFVPEQFEFADARVRLPDYLPREASYVAETTYQAAHTGEYAIAGETTAARLSVDGRPLDFGRVPLAAGPHDIRIAFRAAESSPRIRIAPLDGWEDLRWTGLHLSPRESLYLQAAIAQAAGSTTEASDLLRHSELATTAIGSAVLEQPSTTSADIKSASAHTSCGDLQASIRSTNTEPDKGAARQLQSCAPDSLDYARWLANAERHLEATEELKRMLREWPLDRDAHRMLIAELQRVGKSAAADRAAADFLTIAPNARDFRRMAQNVPEEPTQPGTPFYEPYRRPTPAALPAFETSLSPELILLQDKVSIARLDGSVSLYVHRVVEIMTKSGADEFKPLAVPEGAQSLTTRVAHAGEAFSAPLPSLLKAGDVIEEEYVVNYTGDGGMIAHSEAFQYVFNDFDFPLLSARFVVLAPSKQSPGYVIASGSVPELRVETIDDLRAQIWEQENASSVQASDPGIVRVVENENGWSIPPSVERRRNLETIHPGPRPHEA